MKNLSTLLVWARAARTNAVCAMFALMLLFVFASPAAAQVEINPTNFPDATFRQYVRTQFDKDNNGTLSEAEINAVTTIGATKANDVLALPSTVANLTGIKLFPKLKTLYCYSNKLTGSLDVSDLKALDTLWCHSNKLTAINTSGCSALKNLNCKSNQLESLNLNDSKATLRELNCNTNKLQNIDMSNFSVLDSLDCRNQKSGSTYTLKSLNVSGCTNLVMFRFNLNNNLQTLNVSNCKALKQLLANKTQNFTLLTSLDASGCTALETLYCNDNQLTSLNVSGCTALKDFRCHANKLTGSLNVSGFDKLTTFYCYQNQLTGLNVSGCTALTKLNVQQYSGNPLKSLDAGGCTALTTLEWNGTECQLSTLNVSGCTALDTLYCNDNQLTSLDVSGCTALKILNCYGNQLTTLDVSSNKALRALNCGKNKLTGLGDVHFDASLLEELHCGENGFTTLDVSGCTALKILNCYGNELTTLDVRSNKALITLSCGKNKFASQDDIHINSSLQKFWCEDSELLQSLDLSGNKTLMQVVCWNCPLLTDVDMSNCPNLVECHVPQNPVLRNLNVSGCPNLKTEYFAIFDIPLLQKVDISGCTSLTTFDPGGKFLTILNASGCTSLTRVAYTGGSLTSLNVSGCTALQTLQVSRNQLTSLDLSSLTTLTALSCDGNRLKRLVLPNIDWNKVKWCSSQGNHLPLSTLYGFRTMESYKTLVEKGKSTTGQIFQDWPQSDTAYVSLMMDSLDLSSEKKLGPDGGKVTTKFKYKFGENTTSGDLNTDQSWNVGSSSDVASELVFEYTAAKGEFRFFKSGTHIIELTNTLVKGTGTGEGAARPFTWIVKVGLDSYRDIALQSADAAMGDVTGAGRYAKGAAVRITAPEKPGHRFVNWTHSEGGAVFGTKWDTTFNITENLNLTANFTPVYTIQTQANDVTMGIVRGRGKYIKNDNVTLTATPDPAFRFLRWKKGETVESTESTYTFPATENATFTAEFEWITYTIGVQSNNTEWGTASRDKANGIYKKDSVVILTATPKPRYRLKAWKNAAGKVLSTTSPYTFNATADTTLTAEFELITHSVKVNVEPAEGGSVSGAGTYEEGTYFILSATPSEGYRFKEWRKGSDVLEGTEKEYKHIVDGPTEVTAVFELIPVYAITVQANASDKGTVSISSQPSRDINSTNKYREGDAITITASAAPEHYFVCWKTATGAVFTKMKDTTFEAKADLMLTAEFAVIPTTAVRVTVKPNGFSLGEAAITGDGVYEPGTEVTITATEKVGGRFVNWRRVVGNNKVEFATNHTHTFTVTENMELWAYFVNKPPHDIQIKSNDEKKGSVEGRVDGENIGASVPENANVHIKATQKDGCHFVQWQYVDYDAGIEVFTKKADTTFKAYRSFVLTAVFDSNTYKITALPEDEVKGSVTGSGIYNEQANVTVTATAKVGYRFKEWRDAAAEATAGPLFSEASYTFKAVKDLTLTACFDDLYYDITLRANNGDWGEVSGGGHIREGDDVEIRAAPKAHCRFVKWIHTESKELFTTDPNAKFKAKENLDLKAVFEPITYKITVKSDNPQWGNTTPKGENMEYKEGSEITVNAVPSDGYRFVRWKDGKTGQEISRSAQHKFTVEGDKELVAVFEEATWNVNVQYDNTLGSVSITAAAGLNAPYKHKAAITVTATPKEGCRFVAWKEGETQLSNEKTYTFNIVREMNLTAEFERIPVYTITVRANNDGMGGVTGGGSYREDSTVIIEATAKPGHYFVCWKTATGKVLTRMKRHAFQARGNMTLTAEFAAIPTNAVQIRVRPNSVMEGEALITGDGIYEPGTEVTISVAPKLNYRFENWKRVIGTERTLFTTKPDTTFAATEDLELWAYFVNVPPHTITVQANNDDWGVVSGGDESVPENADVHITATPKPGYRFVNWKYIDREAIQEVFATAADTIFKATQNLTLTAYFEPITHTVTVLSSDEAKGRVYQSGNGVYEEGSMATVYAVANEGYGFSAWMKDDEPVSLDATYAFEVDQDVTLTANFVELPLHRITVSSNIANAGILSGDGLYKENTMATLRATAKVGYRFVHWKKDDQVFCTKPDTTFMVTEAMSFVAYFDSVMYTVAVQTANAYMGSVSGGGTYKGGTEAAVSATPNEGYRFAKWKHGNADFGFSADTTFMVLEDITLTAYFEEIPVEEDPSYTITVRANDGTLGSALLDIGISSAIYKKDADVTIVAKPTGAKSFFVKWTRLGNDGTEVDFSTEATYTFKAFDNLVLTAYFDLRESDELGLYVKDRVIYLPEPMGKVQVFSTMGQFLYEGEGMAFRMARSGVFVLRIKGKNYKVLVP